jgi:MFS family permease
MASIVLAMLVASMDSTIVNTTMPTIAKELGGARLYAWSFAAYMIASTVLSPIAGRLSDLFGRKKVYTGGIVLFLAGSLLCGTANSMLQLVLYRAFQGIGAGFMMPFPSIIAGDLFSVEHRGRIQAFFTAMWGISSVLAPLLGSLFVEYSTWRWIFYVNGPICVLAFLLLLPYKEVYEPKRAQVDVLGALLFAAGVSLLLAVTVTDAGRLPLTAGGIALLAAFFAWERRHASPIVPIALLRNRPVAGMNANTFLACVATFGMSSYVPLFLQMSGYSLFLSGVALVGMSFGWMAAAVPAGKWILRYGYRPLLVTGNGIIVLTALWFWLTPGGTLGFWYAFAGMTAQGAAFGMVFTVSMIGAQQLVDAKQKGISSSLQMFARNIGTAIGVTMMGLFVASSSGEELSSSLAGMHPVFAYGLAGSLVALASLLIVPKVRERQTA